MNNSALILIIIAAVLVWSFYYQYMTWKYQLTKLTIPMRLEDRIINEIGYHVYKKGYHITFYRKPKGDNEFNYSLAVKETNIPKNKLKIIKYLSIIIIIITPAWGFREYDEDMDVMDDNYKGDAK